MTGRTIVCGVDDSNDARVALRLAARLSDGLGAELVVAHVVQPPPVMYGLGPTARELNGIPAEALLAAGEALVGRIVEEEELGEATVRVGLGFPADRLADVADDEGAELIVVGSRGRGAFKATLLGSVSTDLIGVARCPVLVVPPAAAAREMGWGTHWRGAQSSAASEASREKELADGRSFSSAAGA